jgi:hypothetical protein
LIYAKIVSKLGDLTVRIRCRLWKSFGSVSGSRSGPHLVKLKKNLVQNLAFLMLVAVRCHLIFLIFDFLTFVIPFYVGSGYQSESATRTVSGMKAKEISSGSGSTTLIFFTMNETYRFALFVRHYRFDTSQQPA